MVEKVDAEQEELFVAALDAGEAYLALQESLGECLRSGFLNMAKARYALGPHQVTGLQHPKRMRASVGLQMSGSELELVERRAEPRPGGARGSSSGSPAGDAEALSSTLAGVHLEDAGADVLGALAAKYSCDYSAGPPGDAAPQESPLHWYGQLVPPALKEAEADFKSALGVIVRLANTQRKLRASLAPFEQASASD